MTGSGMTDPAVTSPAPEGARSAALQARLRKMLVAIVVMCVALGAAGFAFVRWMMTLPPGTLKAP